MAASRLFSLAFSIVVDRTHSRYCTNDNQLALRSLRILDRVFIICLLKPVRRCDINLICRQAVHCLAVHSHYIIVYPAGVRRPRNLNNVHVWKFRFVKSYIDFQKSGQRCWRLNRASVYSIVFWLRWRQTLNTNLGFLRLKQRHLHKFEQCCVISQPNQQDSVLLRKGNLVHAFKGLHAAF